jgi:hypothetical protein
MRNSFREWPLTSNLSIFSAAATTAQLKYGNVSRQKNQKLNFTAKKSSREWII